jgi:hypothetical protein
MKRASLFLMLAGFVLAMAASSRAATNLLYNPSFEIAPTPSDPDELGGTEDYLGRDEWGYNSSGAATVELIQDPGVARTGDWNGHIVTGSGSTGWIVPWVVNTPVEEGKVYYTGFWVKDLRPGGNDSAVAPTIRNLYYNYSSRTWDLVPAIGQDESAIDIPRDGRWHYVTHQTQPADGAADVQMIETLSWTHADNAALHELYFGTDRDAVNNATST